MATAAQVKALVASHAVGDDVRFYATAMRIAAVSEKRGHTTLANDIRALVNGARGHAYRSTAPVGSDVPAPEFPVLHVSDMVLTTDVSRRISTVLAEQRGAGVLRDQGFEPGRKLLLTGPSGTGKTMTARVLAGELKLPVIEMDLSGLSSTDGEESTRALREAFTAPARTRGIYVFDELDVVARGPTVEGRPGSDLLATFCRLLEEDCSSSVIVATARVPGQLNPATFRHFDAWIEYPLPNSRVMQDVIVRRLHHFALADVDWPALASTASGLSHGEITVAAERAGKQALLDGTPDVDSHTLSASLRQVRELLRMPP